MTFIAQNAPDIQKKLQEVEGDFGMPMSQLVDFASKIFNGRDQASEESGAAGQPAGCCAGLWRA